MKSVAKQGWPNSQNLSADRVLLENQNFLSINNYLKVLSGVWSLDIGEVNRTETQANLN